MYIYVGLGHKKSSEVPDFAASKKKSSVKKSSHRWELQINKQTVILILL